MYTLYIAILFEMYVYMYNLISNDHFMIFQDSFLILNVILIQFSRLDIILLIFYAYSNRNANPTQLNVDDKVT